MDYTPLKEFNHLDVVDVMGLNSGGRFLLVEIKSSVADFKSDKNGGNIDLSEILCTLVWLTAFQLKYYQIAAV